MSKHNENILELVSKTIYETTFMSKDKDGSYRRQLDRIKKMVKMYAEDYAGDYNRRHYRKYYFNRGHK